MMGNAHLDRGDLEQALDCHTKDLENSLADDARRCGSKLQKERGNEKKRKKRRWWRRRGIGGGGGPKGNPRE